MANVIEKEMEVSVERQAQLMPLFCNWGLENYAVKGAYAGEVIETKGVV